MPCLQRLDFTFLKVTEKPVYDETEEDLADVALAKWWRKTGKNLIDPAIVPNSDNPNTIINFIQGYINFVYYNAVRLWNCNEIFISQLYYMYFKLNFLT